MASEVYIKASSCSYYTFKNQYLQLTDCTLRFRRLIEAGIGQALSLPTVALQTQKAREHGPNYLLQQGFKRAALTLKKKAVGKGGDHRVKWRRD